MRQIRCGESGQVAESGEQGGLRICESRQSRGDGMPELIAALVGFAQDYFGAGEGGLISRDAAAANCCRRQRLRCSAALMWSSTGEELAAEELRVAAHSLGRLLGRVDVEDILDVIFRDSVYR